MSAPIEDKSWATSRSLWAAVAVVLTLALVGGGAFALGWGTADRAGMPWMSNSAITQPGHDGPMMSWAQSHDGDVAWMRDHMDELKWMRHHDDQWHWIQGHPSMWTWMREHWGDMARIGGRWERRDGSRPGTNGGDAWCW